MKRIFNLALGGLVVSLSACSSVNGSAPVFHEVLSDTVEQDGRACVRQSDIRGYGVLDHDVISIDARRNYYLAMVMPGCHALGTSPAAIFEERFSEVCGGGMHKVYTGDDHCTIRKMFEFESREAAFEAHQNAVDAYNELREAPEKE